MVKTGLYSLTMQTNSRILRTRIRLIFINGHECMDNLRDDGGQKGD